MSKKLTTTQFIERAQAIHGNLYCYDKVAYINNKTKIEIICSEHGSFWQNAANHIDKQSGCPTCSFEKKSNKFFVDNAIQIHGDLYCYDKVRYVNNYTNIEIVCKTHGSFWQLPYTHISQKSGCPKCNSSKGELAIRNFLISNDIEFVEQYRNPNCKAKYMLPFDFFLPKYNLLIEYHGQQHYEFVPYIQKTVTKFESQQKHDKIKREWAIDNGYQYLEIPYTKLQDIDNLILTYLEGKRMFC